MNKWATCTSGMCPKRVYRRTSSAEVSRRVALLWRDWTYSLAGLPFLLSTTAEPGRTPLYCFPSVTIYSHYFFKTGIPRHARTPGAHRGQRPPRSRGTYSKTRVPAVKRLLHLRNSAQSQQFCHLFASYSDNGLYSILYTKKVYILEMIL